MASRARLFLRSLHTTRISRAQAPRDVDSHYNEPGGRLFGEAIRKPGERRPLFDWEVPYIGTLILAGLMLGFGLNSRPDTSITTWAREEAMARQMAAEAKEGDANE